MDLDKDSVGFSTITNNMVTKVLEHLSFSTGVSLAAKSSCLLEVGVLGQTLLAFTC